MKIVGAHYSIQQQEMPDVYSVGTSVFPRDMQPRPAMVAVIKVIQDLYDGCTAPVRTLLGTTESFEVKVGLHQDLALSPLLFITVMDVIIFIRRNRQRTTPCHVICG